MDPFYRVISDQFDANELIRVQPSGECDIWFFSETDFRIYESGKGAIGQKKHAVAAELVEFKFPHGGLWHIVADDCNRPVGNLVLALTNRHL